MPDAVQAGDRVLDRLGDLRLELGRGGAGLRDQHLHDWDVDVRKPRDRHRTKADDAEQEENGEGNDRGNRLADRPGGNVQAHPELLASVRSREYRPDDVAWPQEGRRTRDQGLTLRYAFANLHLVAFDDPRSDAALLDASVAPDKHARQIPISPQSARRRAGAPVSPREIAPARSETARTGMRRIGKRDPDLPCAARLVDFLVDQPHFGVDFGLDARQAQFGGHAYGEPDQRLLGHFGFE